MVRLQRSVDSLAFRPNSAGFHEFLSAHAKSSKFLSGFALLALLSLGLLQFLNDKRCIAILSGQS